MVISLTSGSLTHCICGYLDLISLPGSFIGAFVAWYAMIAAEKVELPRRIIIYIACILTALILLKNTCDILLWGHNPLL